MNIASASQSRPHGLVSRSLTAASTSHPRAPKFPSTRNFVVFPVQLGKEKSPLEAFPFTSYTTIDLKTRHSYDPNLAQDVDEIWVNTASYYKQKQSPQHEFIIFSVTGNNGMQNFIALDRNVNVKGSANLISRGGKGGPPAQDYFHVSHYADMESLINHCGHTASENMCTHVEQVGFEHKAITFAQLVVLASTVSEACPSYQLGATNCYWFASLIWECMFSVFGDKVATHNKHTEERGKFKGLKIQGGHSNFQDVVQKYRNDLIEFATSLRDDAMSVVDRRSRRMSAQVVIPPDFEKAALARVPATDPHRSRTVSTSATPAVSVSTPRPQATGTDRDRKAERTRATSFCPTTDSRDSVYRRSVTADKDLPSLPPGASVPQPRTRAHPTDGSRRDSRRDSRSSFVDASFISAPLPDVVTRGSNRYSDIGKSFEQATAAYSQAPSRPASAYAAPNQIKVESSPSRVPDSNRLKAHSLPVHPNPPSGDLNKDRTRSPSLPVGPTKAEVQDASKDSRDSTSERPGSAPRTRTTSSIGRLRRALPKLLLPTVSESEDIVCESPELSSWTEIESADYEATHPFADGASERLSFIEFPQPPARSLPAGLPGSRSSTVSGSSGVRVAQGHRVHPSRLEYSDGSRKRRSQSPHGGDRDSKYSQPRS